MEGIRVGIDLTGIWRRQTGIFRYTAELARHLLLQVGDEPQLQYILFFAREVHPDFVPFLSVFQPVICPTRNELLSKQLWFPGILPGLRLRVMHYPTFPPPYLQVPGPRTVMTFYDAGPWRYAQTQTWYGRHYFRTLLARGSRSSAQIVTLSTHAKAEIGHFLGQQYLARIAIAPGAVRPAFGVALAEDCLQEVRARYHLSDRYLLTVSTVEPRKNLSVLLDAYTLLRQQLGDACPQLVIAGRQGWHYEDILQHMQALQGYVHFLGHIPDQDLIALYQMATCLIFPSLYEGFGLPVVEAMTAGCPVITTTSSSLPEVAGDAALLVDPLDRAAMAQAMQRVVQDEPLRQSLIAAGRIQAARFSWEKTAQLHRELYLQIART